MANTAALLGNLLNTNADINFYTQQQIYWSNKYEANSAKLSKQVSYEEKWESAYDDATNVDKKCSINGTVWKEKDEVLSDAMADKYAHAKVKEYNEELSLELAQQDMDYDTMKTMYETMLEELRAQQESEKSVVSNSAQDTGLLQS
mgnify:FL=1